MSQMINISAYAKVNLGLRVVSKREDGFHDILSVFQRVSLCDFIQIEATQEVILYDGPKLTAKSLDNLCVKAAQSFRAHFGEHLGVRINLRKQIPVGAGLGGGSSDAGAVLAGMAKIYEVDPSDPGLLKAALEVGSDVSFFLADRSVALVSGRGEKMTNGTGLSTDKWLVVVYPGFEVSTAWAYDRLDESLTFKDIDTIFIARQFSTYEGGIPTADMSNDFDAPVFAAHPELSSARDSLLESGAEYAGLTGSGSALYGIFDAEAAARSAATGWRSPWHSFVCRPY